jgi:hypothetical protein
MTQQPPFGPPQPGNRPFGFAGGPLPGRQWPAHHLPAQQFPTQQLSPQQPPTRQLPMQHQPFPAGSPGRFPFPGSVPSAAPMPVIRDYREPQWGGEWLGRPSKSKSATIAGGIAVLVAAIVTTIVLITQHSTTADPVSQGSQAPPTPISVTMQTTDDRPTDETTETSTADETTAEPATSAPTRSTTARTRTTNNGADRYRRDQQAAATVARAWATAVNNGDYDGVAALSCRQDLAAFASGASQNPASLTGRLTLKFRTVITARPKGIATFGVTPVKDGQPTLKTFVTMQDNRWLVCATVTELSDL